MKFYITFLITITCITVIVYVGSLLFKEFMPINYKEQMMHCLELGSNVRAQTCISLLKQPQKSILTPIPTATPTITPNRIQVVVSDSGVTATNITNQTLYNCFFSLKAKGDNQTEYKGFIESLTEDDFFTTSLRFVFYETRTGAKDVSPKILQHQSVTIPFGMFYEFDSKPINHTFSPTYTKDDIHSITSSCNNVDGSNFEQTITFKRNL